MRPPTLLSPTKLILCDPLYNSNMSTSITLYGACRRNGFCLCGLCGKIAPKNHRQVPGLKMELICSWHSGWHRNSCFGYPPASGQLSANAWSNRPGIITGIAPAMKDGDGQCIPPRTCTCDPFWRCRKDAADYKVMVWWLNHDGPGRPPKRYDLAKLKAAKISDTSPTEIDM